MFWIQEPASKQNNSGYRLFYCESEADILNLPTQKEEGKQVGDDTVCNKRCAYGSEAVVINTGEVYVLQKSTDTWEVLGG